MRANVIVADDFYADPDAVRAYALSLDYYYPYQDRERVSGGEPPSWYASRFLEASSCPFKSSATLLDRLAALTGETVEIEHWKRSYPTTPDGRAARAATIDDTCLWNCSFHVKPDRPQPLGEGVHNHVTDVWNAVGVNGWAGIVYLSGDAPVGGGLKTWRNRRRDHDFDWMTPSENWELIDDIGNVYNRLVLARGDVPHSGSQGWGHDVATGRLFQTFFFKTVEPGYLASVDPF